MNLKRREVELASAYVKLDDWVEANPDAEVLAEKIRLLNGRIAFVFDPENAEYLELLGQLVADTRALTKTLQEEINRREMKVWVKGGKINGCRQDYRRMGFFIRPPFLTSQVEKNITNRMQANDNVDSFVLHFDARRQLQTIRMWKPQERETLEAKKIYDFRMRMVILMNSQYQFLQDNYGNWELIAAKIADVIETVRAIQSKINWEKKM